jgi:hypothetical protein
MPYEADAVLSKLLLYNPHNTVARIMRMIICANLAQEQTDFSLSELYFNRALAEADFIMRRCDSDEISWCEIGLLYYGRAKKYIQSIRRNNTPCSGNISQKDVIDNLIKAEELFLKGMVASATGKDGSSFLWFLCSTGLREFFAREEKFLHNSKYLPLMDNFDIFRNVGAKNFRTIGFLRGDLTSDDKNSDEDLACLIDTLRLILARYENTLLSRSYIPYMKYLFAVLFWDFLPKLNVEICNIVLQLLNEACREAEKLAYDNLSVYQLSVNYISPDKFIRSLQDTIAIIKKLAPEEELKKGNKTKLDEDKFKEMSRIKLILLELDWNCHI